MIFQQNESFVKIAKPDIIIRAALIHKKIRNSLLWFDLQFDLKFNLQFDLYASLPWNQRTLIGWIALNIFSCFAALFYLIINYSFLAFFIGICEHHHAFFKSFKVSIGQLDEYFGSNVNKTKSKLVELIHFHILARE